MFTARLSVMGKWFLQLINIMAINAIFYDNQSRQITDEQLCRDILRVAPMRVANDVMGISNINMFAKYKPVRKSAPSYVRYSDYWKADDGMCGINIPLVPNLAAVLTANWSYVRPRSGMGSNEPAIVSDFYYWGRYNYAAIPFLAPYPFQYEYEHLSGASFTVFFSNMTEQVGDDNLKMSDVPFLANKYLAVCIGNTLADNRVVTSAGTIGQGYNSVTVSAEWMRLVGIGTHNIYHFLTTERHTEGSQEAVVGIYPVYKDAAHPNPQKVTIEPYSSKLEFTWITQYTTSWKGTLRNIEDTYANPTPMPLLIFFPITAVNKTDYEITEFFSQMYVDISYANGLTHSSQLNYLYDSNWNSDVSVKVPERTSKLYYLGVDISFFPYTGDTYMTFFSFRFKRAGGFGNCNINLIYQ